MTLLDYVLVAIVYLAGGIVCHTVDAYLNARFGLAQRSTWSSFYNTVLWPFQVIAVLIVVASYPFVLLGRKARELGERHRQESSR